MAKIGGFLKRHVKLLIVLVVIIVLIALVPRLLLAKAAKSADTSYYTQTPQTQDLQVTLSGSGTIEPNDQYSITSMVQGEIIDAPFEEGDVVEEGQLLYQFSTEDAEDSVKSSELNMKQAQQNYDDAEDALSMEASSEGYVKKLYVSVGDKISAGTAIADLYDNTVMTLKVPFLASSVKKSMVGDKASVYIDDADETVSGTVKSVDSTTSTLSGNVIVKYVTIEVKNPGGINEDMTGSASIGDVDCAGDGTFSVKSESTLTAEGSGTIESLNIEEGSYVSKGDIYLTLDDSNMTSSEMSLENAQNQLESAEKNLENYTITAPISGTVITKNAKEGDSINSNSSNYLAVIYDLSTLKFEMKVDELDVMSIATGMEVIVTADALEGVEMTGHITNISLQATTNGGVTEYPVTVEMDDPGDLLPGMNVNATIVINEQKDALCIPSDALQRGNYVYVKDKEGETYDTEDSTAAGADQAAPAVDSSVPEGFHKVEVEVGMSSESYVQILSGLSADDEVYVPRAESVDMTSMMLGGLTGDMGGGDMPSGGGDMPSGGGDMGGGMPSGGGPGGM